MRRSLVLGDETARHPFLQSLPPHVRGGGQPVLRVAAQEAPPSLAERAGDMGGRWGHAAWYRLRRGWRGLNLTASDMRLFLLAYCACFLATSAFIW
jgi:hypothetical protein